MHCQCASGTHDAPAQLFTQPCNELFSHKICGSKDCRIPGASLQPLVLPGSPLKKKRTALRSLIEADDLRSALRAAICQIAWPIAHSARHFARADMSSPRFFGANLLLAFPDSINYHAFNPNIQQRAPTTPFRKTPNQLRRDAVVVDSKRVGESEDENQRHTRLAATRPRLKTVRKKGFLCHHVVSQKELPCRQGYMVFEKS